MGTRVGYVLLRLVVWAAGMSALIGVAAAILHRPFLDIAVAVWPGLLMSLGLTLWTARKGPEHGDPGVAHARRTVRISSVIRSSCSAARSRCTVRSERLASSSTCSTTSR